MQTVGKFDPTPLMILKLTIQYELVRRGDGHLLYCRSTGFGSSDHH